MAQQPEAPVDAHAEKGAGVLPRCPNCGWRNVRLSRPKGAIDTVLSVISVRPFRCRSCAHRYYRFYRPATVED